MIKPETNNLLKHNFILFEMISKCNSVHFSYMSKTYNVFNKNVLMFSFFQNNQSVCMNQETRENTVAFPPFSKQAIIAICHQPDFLILLQINS